MQDSSSSRSPERCCSVCGLNISNNAVEGLCAACLLRQAALDTRAVDIDFDSDSKGSASITAPETPTVENVAIAFPHLEIVERIGRGGMGTVFKARQPKLNRFVALKILAPHLAGTSAPTFAERFLREAQLLARLSHPNIVTVHDFGQSGGFYYLMMEFVDGVNLRQAIRSEHFSPEQTLSIVPKICEALQYAHEEGVLHRDIKPENILLDTKGRVKIADFGIASVARWTANGASAPNGDPLPLVAGAGERLTQTGQILGTPNYMAPEQIERPSEVDHRADIYSLGVVFYELLTGELPLGRFAPPSEKSDTSPNVDRIVLKALEKERERRQQSAGEMKTEIETATQLPIKRRNESKPNRRFAVWGLVLLIVAVALPWGPLSILAHMRDSWVFEIRAENDLLQEQFRPVLEQLNKEQIDIARKRSELRNLQGEPLLEAQEALRREVENIHKKQEEELRIYKEASESNSKKQNEIAGKFNFIADAILVFCGILAAVGTIFGWVHLVRIRQSTEKNGFWLGLFVALIALIPALWCGIQLLFLGPYDPPFRGVMATIGNITAIVVPLWLIVKVYRWASGTPPFQPPKPVVEKAVVVKEPEPITEPPQEKPGLWRRIITEIKTWPIWATILIVCVAGPMVLYVPILFLVVVVGPFLLVAEGGLQLYENWPVLSPLITPVGIVLLVILGLVIRFYRRKQKKEEAKQYDGKAYVRQLWMAVSSTVLFGGGFVYLYTCTEWRNYSENPLASISMIFVLLFVIVSVMNILDLHRKSIASKSDRDDKDDE